MSEFEIPAEFIASVGEGMLSAAEIVDNHETNIQAYESGQVDNPELPGAIAAYMGAITHNISIEGSSITFESSFPDDDAAQALEEGTHPVLGGDHGTVHHLTGDVTQSKVNPNLWGTDASWLAIQPMMIKENLQKQYQTMVVQGGRDKASENSSMLAAPAKEYIAEKLRGILQ